MTSNPYNYNMPVAAEMFYGRHEQLSFIVRQLLAAPGDSIALIGGRRMGKTSLLEAIERQLAQEGSVDRQSRILPLPIFLDFSGEGVDSPYSFFNRIIEESQISWPYLADDDRLFLTGQFTADGSLGPHFRRLLLTWGRRIANSYGQQPRLILLLDECEQIVDQPWTADLYGVLRYLLDGRSTRPFLKVVMAGSHRFLTQVQQRGSPLENILQYEYLRPFDQITTNALIQEPTDQRIEADVATTIWQESGGHPFLTQYLLHTLWEHGLDRATVADVTRWAGDFPQKRHDFTKWLTALGDSGLVAYKAVVQAGQPLDLDEVRATLTTVQVDIDQSLDALHYHGLLQKDGNGRYRPDNGMFRRWFVRNYVPEYGETAVPVPPAPTAKGTSEQMTPQFKHGYALLIGVGGDLPVTVNDAVGLRDLLVDPQRCAYPPAQVKVLTETAATRQGILDGLDWLGQQVAADPQATAVVYFSGHGGRAWSNYYLIPHDYDASRLAETAVTGAEFSQKLRAINAQKLLVLLDCCHAGGMAEAKAPGFIKSPMPPEMESILTAGSGRVVIASSRKDELSYTGTPFSVFTQALREGLAGLGAAEQDGYAYIADIALYVGRTVPNRTQERQHPILKLAAADNFAVAYYAAGNKAPLPLENAQAYPLPVDNLDANLTIRYRRILQRYQTNLLDIEEQIAQFYDQASVPLDILRTRQGILDKIEETEQKIRGDAQKTGWQPPPVSPMLPTLEDVLSRLDRMESSLGGKLDDLKRGQRVIYQRITPVDQAAIEAILTEVRQQRQEQQLMADSVKAVVTTLADIQQQGLPIDDAELEQALADIYREVVSDLSLQQQFELTLPVIPFLLEYKLALGAGVDLGAVWQELVGRVKRVVR